MKCSEISLLWFGAQILSHSTLERIADENKQSFLGFGDPDLGSIYGVHFYVNDNNKTNETGLLDFRSLAKNPNSKRAL